MHIRKPLTVSNIYKSLSDYDIFINYCTNFKEIGKPFISDLRQDEHPSCYIYSTGTKLLYKDFGDGTSLASLDYVMRKFGLDFLGAIKRINIDFNLQLGFDTTSKLDVPMAYFGLPDKQPSLEELKLKKASIKVTIRPWSIIHDLKYWKDKYNISVNDLNKFNVYAISHYWINDKLYGCGNNSYAYYFGKQDNIDVWKIYQPYNNKSSKWFSNADSSVIQGYNQLAANGDLLIITKALKDVIILDKLGYNSVAPNSEGIVINQEQFDDLNSRFKKIVVLFDNDEAGIIYANKYKLKYNIQTIEIPLDKGVKDPSDFVDKYSYDELKQFIDEEIK